MSNNLNVLRKIAKDLKNINEDDICEKIILAIAMETNAKDAKPELSYSYICRDLNKRNNKDLKEFQDCFKKSFDEAFINGLENPEEVALMQSIQEVGYE
jgi:hypothetical protein